MERFKWIQKYKLLWTPSIKFKLKVLFARSDGRYVLPLTKDFESALEIWPTELTLATLLDDLTFDVAADYILFFLL